MHNRYQGQICPDGKWGVSQTFWFGIEIPSEAKGEGTVMAISGKIDDISRVIAGPIFLHEISCRYTIYWRYISTIYHWHIAIFSSLGSTKLIVAHKALFEKIVLIYFPSNLKHKKLDINMNATNETVVITSMRNKCIDLSRPNIHPPQKSPSWWEIVVYKHELRLS